MFFLSKCRVNYSLINYVRKYSSDVPIKMAYNVFQTKTVDASKPPLIIMHGLFGSKQNWRGIARALELKTNRKIITVDARNHGDSPHHDNHSSQLMCEDIVDLMQEQGIAKASILGHSMGGRTMMYTVLKYPELVEKTIIVDISPLEVPRDFFAMEMLFKAMIELKVPNNLSMPEGRKYAEKELKQVEESKETVDFMLLNLRKGPDGSFYWAANVEGLYKNLRQFTTFMRHIEGFPPCKAPVMFICGKQSNFVDPNSWPEIQKIFPNSEAHWLENAGHLVHFDQPAKFLDLVVGFLNK